jgi:hypothetical protein
LPVENRIATIFEIRDPASCSGSATMARSNGIGSVLGCYLVHSFPRITKALASEANTNGN